MSSHCLPRIGVFWDRLRPVFVACLIIWSGLTSRPVDARAQSIFGPDASRPESPAPDSEAAPLPSGRVLKPIPIPKDDPAADLFAGGTITVRGFRFVGNEAISDEALARITQPYVGEGRRYGALLEARDRVTRAYIDAGFISSGAVLPERAVRDGIVELQIIEGRLTTIDVETDGRLRDRYLVDRLTVEGRDRTLNLNDLRRRLRILKRDPNVESITTELVPGDERGESVLSVSVVEPTSWRVSVEGDDYVTPAIGGYRGRVSAGVRNLSGWGEDISIAYSGAEGLDDIDARVAVPITRWDTVLELRVRQAWSDITESPIDEFNIESRTQAYSLRLSQPILRERSHQLGTFFAAEWKRGNSTVFGGLPLSLDPNDSGQSTVAALRIGMDGWWRGERRAISGRVTLSQGLDILEAGSDVQDLDGNFTSALFQLQGIEYLPWYGLRVLARLDAQVADDELLGLEQFPAGGHASVRGYRENLLVRDQGIVGSLELRMPLPTFSIVNNLEVGVFGDGGYAQSHNAGSGDRLGSIGIGLHATLAQYVTMSIEFAESLNDPNGNLVGNHLQDDGLHFSLRVDFP